MENWRCRLAVKYWKVRFRRLAQTTHLLPQPIRTVDQFALQERFVKNMEFMLEVALKLDGIRFAQNVRSFRRSAAASPPGMTVRSECEVVSQERNSKPAALHKLVGGVRGLSQVMC